MGRVIVLHPDLGVGGAERLIIDATKALQDSGHEVRIYTNYHDKNRCFEETKNGTITTIVVGSWIPRTIFGRFHALIAYLKMILLAIYVSIYSRHDMILCDQISACIPFLKLDFRNKPRVVFYCHFPDSLLTERKTIFKSLYRKPIDYFEEVSTAAADVILVNSDFTSKTVKRTFKSLTDRQLSVLYPCVEVKALSNCNPNYDRCDETLLRLRDMSKTNFMFFSLNRFERKKNLKLAITAMSKILTKYNKTNIGGLFNDDSKLKAHLIVAGGFDERLSDSVLYLNELSDLVTDLGLCDYVTFLKSPSDNDKLALLKLCHAVVYTPENEHFGIVPLEAMAMSKPVIATRTGGPLETIESERTGILCEASEFADAMLRLYSDRKLCVKLGANGYDRAKRYFSYETFRDNLNNLCHLPKTCRS